MRLLLLEKQIGESLPNSAEAQALHQQLDATIRRAVKMPAESSQEAIALVKFLDNPVAINILQHLEVDTPQQILDRFMEDPKIADRLASYAAERAWSRGQFAEAGTIVLTHTPDLTEATNTELGWVALSGLPEANTAQEILRTRTTPSAKAWLGLSEASYSLAAGDIAAADQAIPNALPRNSTLETIALYLRGKVRLESGETARATQSWQDLLETAPSWSLAQQALSEAYMALGRPLEARLMLLQNRQAGTEGLYLRAEVAIDEAGITRPRTSDPDSYQIISTAIETLPNSTELLCLAARAALATERTQEAGQYVDQLLAQQPLMASHDIALLATRLDRFDPDRAAALRSVTASDTTDPAITLMLANADAYAGHPDQGLARLDAGLEQADDASKLNWELAQAYYRDRLDDPDAPAHLLELSALHPDKRFVQLTVLQSKGVWNTPASLGPVVQRFRKIAGDRSLQWRLYNNKLELALIDRESDQAVERANSIMFDLVSLTREDPQNVEALDIFAEAAEIAGDNARAAEYLFRAVRAEPKNTARRLRLVNVALPRAGRVEEARQQAQTLADYPLSDPDLLRERARTFERFGFHNLARADWEHLALDGDQTARVNLAYILLNANQTDQADALIAEIIASDSLPDAVLVDAAYYLARRSKVEQGLALLDRLPEQGPLGSREQLAARYLFINTNTLEQARALEARARTEDTPAMWAAVVQAYINIERFDEARRVAAAGLKLHPSAPELTVLTRMFEASEAEDPLAILAFLRSRRSFTETPEADRIVTLFDQRLSEQIDDDQLIEGLEALVEQSPTSFTPREALATAQRVANRPYDMAITLRTAMDAIPADPTVARFATFQFLAIGLNDEALFAARQWQSRLGRPDLAADQTTASLLMQEGRTEEALAALEPWRTHITEARAEQPGDAYLLASALALSDQSADARSLLKPLAEIPGPGLDYCIMLTPFIAATDEQRQWLDSLTPKAIMTESPQTAFVLNHAWWNLASITDIPDDIRAATLTAEELLAKPSGDQFQIRLAAALGRARLGNTEQAASHYRAMLATDPNLLDIHNNLAYLLLSTDNGTTEALEHADIAVQLAQNANTPPERLRSYLDTQALALLANGRADDAVDVFRRALEPDPAWPTGVLGLAEALLAAGELDQAQKALATLDDVKLSADQAARVAAIRADF